MKKIPCCVCFKSIAPIPIISKDAGNQTIKYKLQTLISEVSWKDTFTICLQCLKALNVAVEFRNSCLRTNLIRLANEESELSSEFLCNQNRSSEDEETGREAKDAISEISGIELNTAGYLFEHKEEDKHEINKNGSLGVETSFKSRKCEKHTANLTDLQNKSNVLLCYHCSQPFRSKIMLAKHIKLKHRRKENDKNQSLNEVTKLDECSKCDKSYKSGKSPTNQVVTCDCVKGGSNINYKNDISENECAYCGRIYTTKKILKAHTKQCCSKSSFLEEHKCYKCNSVLKNSEEKYQHILDVHNINLKNNNTCEYCFEEFSSDDSLKSHLNIQHANKKCTVEKNCTKRSYSCEVCSVIFGYVKKLIEHCVKEHQMPENTVKPYSCDECHKRFTSSANLIQHKQYHKDDRPHVCTYCGRSFFTKADVTVHEYTHLNLRKYKCDACDRAFNTNKNLRSHKLVVHTDSSKWKYQCNSCSKKFPLKSGYDQHMKRHSGDKRFKCMACEKSFISNSELKKHKIFHSNERAFKCSHCDKDYKNRVAYDIHLTKVHGIGNAKIPIRKKKFACHICPGTFLDKGRLSRHMCVHTGIKPFVCNVCEKGFSDKSYMKHHLKIVHNIVEIQNVEN